MAKCCDPGAPRIFKVKLNNGWVYRIGFNFDRCALNGTAFRRRNKKVTSEEGGGQQLYTRFIQGKVCRGFVPGIYGLYQ